MRLRRRHPERDIGDLRRQADQRDLGWDAELADEHGKAWHEWPDRDDRGADRPAPPGGDGGHRFRRRR